MDEELVTGADGQLVEWESCFIRPSLLARVRDAVLGLDDPEQMDDVKDALVEELEGKDVVSVGQISARIRRVLKLR